MDVLEAILSRRSIRRYTDEAVGEEVVEQLLRAAAAAPSAHNEQPWHFVVIRDRAVLAEFPKVHPHSRLLLGAPVAIAVCADHELEVDRGVDYWVQDCAAATQNLLLAAHGLGLGACWIGIHPRAERQEVLKKLLGLPASVSCFGLVALGHPAETKGRGERYDAGRVHRERW